MSGHDETHETISEERHQRLCAWVLGELHGDEAEAFESELARSPELRAERERLEATIGLVRESLPAEALPDAARESVLAAADAPAPVTARWTLLRGGGAGWKVAAGIVALFTVLVVVRTKERRALFDGQQEEVARGEAARTTVGSDAPVENALRDERREQGVAGFVGQDAGQDADSGRSRKGMLAAAEEPREANTAAAPAKSAPASLAPAEEAAESKGGGRYRAPSDTGAPAAGGPAEAELAKEELAEHEPEAPSALGYPEGGAGARRKVGAATARSRAAGASPDVVRRSETSRENAPFCQVPTPGEPQVAAAPPTLADHLAPSSARPGRPGAAAPPEDASSYPEDARSYKVLRAFGYADGEEGQEEKAPSRPARWSEDQLDEHCRRLFQDCRIRPRETPAAMFFRFWGDNPFEYTELDPLSTFAVDVDTASYTLARRYLTDGYLPTRAQVRTEEFVNAFDADVPPPQGGETFALALELAPSLFGRDPEMWMLRVAVRGKDVDAAERQPVALTFVVDVSGSMKGERLALVKQAMALCMRGLSTTDSIALVTFNDEPRIVVPMVSGASRSSFEDALVGLTPGGSTNVEGGLLLGYELAAAAITPGAVNRVILLSDGVGNVGETDQSRILARVAGYKDEGIYLNTVGVGMGNHNDVFLEQLADQGDGLCNYVDRLEEARRVFVDELTRTLQPIARDVKVQVAFDPEQVESYRLLGYENRAVADADFRNDAVDAGEVNAGHQVVALYELVRRPSSTEEPLATVRLRWKPPFAVDQAENGVEARAAAEKAFETEARTHGKDALSGYESASYGYRRDVLVAQFAEVLRRSKHARGDSYAKLQEATKHLRETSGNPELDELYRLMSRAGKLIERRDRFVDPRLQRAIDDLAELHYREACREELAGPGQVREPDDVALDADLDRLQRELQERIRRLLRERHVDR